MTNDHDGSLDLLDAQQRRDRSLNNALLEFEVLSKRETDRLERKHPALVAALFALGRDERTYADTNIAHLRERMQQHEAELRARESASKDDTTVMLLVSTDPDGEERWEVYPESTGVAAKDGWVQVLRSFPSGELQLLRAIPIYMVHDIRSVHPEHPMALTAVQWTLENQGQPSWREELNSPKIQNDIAEMSGGNDYVANRIYGYLATEGVYPSEDWIETAKKVAEQLPDQGQAYPEEQGADLPTAPQS